MRLGIIGFNCIMFLAAAAAQGDLMTVRSNWLAFHSGIGADVNDPEVQESLSSQKDIAQFRRDTIAADGSWPDLDYEEPENSDWDVQRHYRYIYWMSVTWHTPHQPLYHDDTLWGAVEKALDYAYSHLLSESRNVSSNWWWNEIGIPMYLGPGLVLAEGNIDSAVFNDSKNTFYARIYSAPHMDGQNAIWSAFNHMLRSFLDNDPARMDLVKAEFVKQCTLNTSGEGVKPDYSFHQHGAQLYTGGYGHGFALDIGEYLFYAKGTSYMLAEEHLNVYANYILIGTAWSRYRNRYDISVRGRTFTRGDASESTITTGPDLGVLALSQTSGWWQNPAVALAKRSSSTNPDLGTTVWGGNRRYPYHYVSSYVKLLENDTTPARIIRGYKHFPYSEHSISRRENWYASVRMLSSRCRSTEYVNGENKTGWCLSDGVLWVYLSHDEYYTNNVMPTLDWQRLPGTTVERKSRAAGEGYSHGTEAFAGGTGTEDFGVSAMKFNANASELTAFKSYFFFDDEIVCLGSNIQCLTANPVETTVDQRRMLDGVSGVTIDGVLHTAAADWQQTLSNPTWIQANDMGYYFPRSCEVAVSRVMQSGQWSDLTINTYPPAGVFTNDMLTLRFEHDATPNGDAYAYAVVPGVAAETMTTYAAEPPFTILAQDDKAHAVRDISSNAVGIVFWEAGKMAAVRTNSPCIVFYRYAGDMLYLTVSEPARTTDHLWLGLNELYEPISLPDGFILKDHAGQTSVRCEVASGANYQMVLRKKKADVLIDDDFGNNQTDRRAGDSLVGTATPVDGRMWSAEMPGDYRFTQNGQVYRQGGTDVRSVSVATGDLADKAFRISTRIRFDASIDPNTAYAIIAVWRNQHLDYGYVSALSSDLYFRVHANGHYELSAMNGAYRPVNAGNIMGDAGQTLLELTPDTFFKMWLAYDPLANRLWAGVDDTLILANYSLNDVIVDGARGFQLTPDYAGLHLEPAASTVAADDFRIEGDFIAASDACRWVGYLAADFNDDCSMDWRDVDFFLQEWLMCNSADENCFAAP